MSLYLLKTSHIQSSESLSYCLHLHKYIYEQIRLGKLPKKKENKYWISEREGSWKNTIRKDANNRWIMLDVQNPKYGNSKPFFHLPLHGIIIHQNGEQRNIVLTRKSPVWPKPYCADSHGRSQSFLLCY